MAQRDRSQGFGFIYVDINDLLAQRSAIAKADQENLHMAPMKETQAIQLNRETPTPAPALVETAPKAPERTHAIQQIRDNLDRLQSLHHKLHAMLEELNKVTGKKTR